MLALLLDIFQTNDYIIVIANISVNFFSFRRFSITRFFFLITMAKRQESAFIIPHTDTRKQFYVETISRHYGPYSELSNM